MLRSHKCDCSPSWEPENKSQLDGVWRLDCSHVGGLVSIFSPFFIPLFFVHFFGWTVSMGAVCELINAPEMWSWTTMAILILFAWGGEFLLQVRPPGGCGTVDSSTWNQHGPAEPGEKSGKSVEVTYEVLFDGNPVKAVEISSGVLRCVCPGNKLNPLHWGTHGSY